MHESQRRERARGASRPASEARARRAPARRAIARSDCGTGSKGPAASRPGARVVASVRKCAGEENGGDGSSAWVASALTWAGDDKGFITEETVLNCRGRQADTY